MLTVLEVSGRYDSDRDEFAAYLARLAEKHHADVIGVTEAQQPRILKAVRKAMPGYRVAKRGQYLVIWKRKRVKGLSPAWLRRLTKTKGLPDWRNLRVMSKRLKFEGCPIRFTVGHAPAGVEFGNGWRRGSEKAAQTSRNGFTAWGRLVRRGKAVQVAMGDFNLDQFREVWRDFTTGKFGAPSIWRGRLPNTGSHGHRLIDSAHYRDNKKWRARVVEAFVDTSRRPDGVDHRAIVFRLDIKRKAAAA